MNNPQAPWIEWELYQSHIRNIRINFLILKILKFGKVVALYETEKDFIYFYVNESI